MTGLLLAATYVIDALIIAVAVLFMLGVAALVTLDALDDHRTRRQDRESSLPNLTHHHTKDQP